MVKRHIFCVDAQICGKMHFCDTLCFILIHVRIVLYICNFTCRYDNTIKYLNIFWTFVAYSASFLSMACTVCRHYDKRKQNKAKIKRLKILPKATQNDGGATYCIFFAICGPLFRL